MSEHDLPYQELNDEDWKVKMHELAMELVMTVDWPWTERQKRLWYIGVLVNVAGRDALEHASIEQMQEWHKELAH